MRLSSLAAGGLPRLEEPCSRAAELPFAVLWLFSKFRTFGPVVRDDADNRGRLQNLLLSVLEQLPKSFQEAHIRLRTVVVPPPLETPSGLQRADRKSVVQGKSVSVSVDLGGRRIIKKKTTIHQHHI